MKGKETKKGRRAFLLAAPALVGGALAWLRRSGGPRHAALSSKARRLEEAPHAIKRQPRRTDGEG